MVTGILLARGFGPEAMGIFSSSIALVAIGGGLLDPGLSNGYIKLVARETGKRSWALGHALRLKILLAGTYALGLVGFLAFRGLLRLEVALFCLGYLLSEAGSILIVDFQIRKRFGFTVLLQMFRAGGLLVSLVVFLISGLPFVYFSWVYFFLQLSLVIFLASKTGFPSGFSFQLSRVRDLLMIGLPFAVGILIYRIMTHFGLSSVKLSMGDSAAGILAVPVKFYGTALLFIIATSQITLPEFHRCFQRKQDDRLARLLNKVVAMMLALGGVGFGIGFFVGSDLISLLLGGEFSAAGLLLPVFLGAAAVKMVAVPFGNVLDSRNLHWWRVAGQGGACFVLVTGVTYWVARGSLYGVGLSILTMELFLMLWYCTTCFVRIRPLFPVRTLVVGVAALGGSVVVGQGAPLPSVGKFGLFVAFFVSALWWGLPQIRSGVKELLRTYFRVAPTELPPPEIQAD